MFFFVRGGRLSTVVNERADPHSKTKCENSVEKDLR